MLIVAEQAGLLRDGVMALLAAAWPDAPVFGAGTLEDAVALLSAGENGCVLLLDLALLDAAGPSGLQRLRAGFPGVRIVVLAVQETRDGILRCLAAGAHGYVAKSAPAHELIRAVRAVQAGGVHVPATLGSSEAVPQPPMHALTGRQRDVLRLMAEGRSTKDIARTLDLAVSTIKVHLAAVYRAVGARNRVEALCRAGLLPTRLGERASLPAI